MANGKPLKTPTTGPTMKQRTIIQGAAMGIQFAGMMLSNKDADMEGWDDYFAAKVNQVALEMMQFAATGKLPTEGE